MSGKCYTNCVEYRAWASMLGRCYNPNLDAFKHYGGRGITVCDRWRHNYHNFLADMGRRPGKEFSLDRKNNDLGYSPDNCKWSTKSEQSQNRRVANRITAFGETRCLSKWARDLGIRQSTLHRRIYIYGWSVEKALSNPVRKIKRAA
jgi:hypothetical protein